MDQNPTPARAPASRDDAILAPTRWLSAFIIPFLVVAFVVLYPVPTSTKRWFAWEIKPTMTPMVLAAAYIGGAFFFAQVLRARAWHTVKVGFIPVTLFASTLGLATLLHWDKFNHGHLAFWLWSGLYFTTPFLVLLVWARNRRHDVAAGPGDVMVPPLARFVIGGTGLAALLLGLYAFLRPERMIDNWPWTATPLTMRVLAAVLMLGVAGLGIYADPRWSTARLMLDVERLMVALILVAAVRAHEQFDTSRPLTWMLGGGLVFVLVASTVLDLQMRRRAPGAPPTGGVTAGRDDDPSQPGQA